MSKRHVMQQRSRILIVDDNPTNVTILEEILGDHYLLATAISGEEALDIALHFQPALVLLDIMLPGIDGYETCQRLRTVSSLRGLKIIMVSGKAMVAERLQGYEMGADDYITKPFDIDELLAKVRVYLRLKSIEEIDQIKTELLSLLGNKTRTLLNGIMAPLQLLIGETDMDEAARSTLLNIMQQSTARLFELFKKAEMLSAMKSGMWDFQLAMEDLCDVVHTVVSAMALQASERAVHIEQELPDTACTLLDWQQMQYVINVLLDNALRFSPEHSRIRVSVRRERAYFCMTVNDQGPGIAPEILPYMFESCSYTDIVYRPEGDGLSLTIARQIVLAHNGTIQVESTPDHGTTFTVRLPVVTALPMPLRPSC